MPLPAIPAIVQVSDCYISVVNATVACDGVAVDEWQEPVCELHSTVLQANANRLKLIYLSSSQRALCVCGCVCTACTTALLTSSTSFYFYAGSNMSVASGNSVQVYCKEGCAVLPSDSHMCCILWSNFLCAIWFAVTFLLETIQALRSMSTASKGLGIMHRSGLPSSPPLTATWNACVCTASHKHANEINTSAYRLMSTNLSLSIKNCA